MINYLFDKIKKNFLNLYEYLQEEPDHKHPRLRFIPNFVLNLIALFLQIIIVVAVLKYILKLIKELIN
jgi:hypothetical protein